MTAEIKAPRQSGVELLKIFAMFAIIIYHSFSTLSEQGIHIETATTSITMFMTQMLYYLGSVGNLIFLVGSAWFLYDSKGLKLNKIAYMLADVFAVSVIMLAVFLHCGVEVSMFDIKRSLLPTTFDNSWYVTAYLALYIVHPLLNIIINKLSQKQLLAYNTVFFILYCCLIFVKKDLFFFNAPISFIGVYLITAYLKKYMPNLMDSKKAHTKALIIGTILLFVVQLGTNFLGLHVPSVYDKMHHWTTSLTNPILLVIIFALFNKFRLWEFKNKAVNYISSLTLLIYLIHANIIFGYYIHGKLLFNTWLKSGRMNIVVFVLIFDVCLFAAATLVSVIYNKLFQPIIHKAADKLLGLICRLYAKLETLILKKLY